MLVMVARYTLLSEARHRTIEIGSFPQFRSAHRHVVQQLETKPGSLLCLGGLVNHCPDQFRFHGILRGGDRMEFVRIRIGGLDDQVRPVAFPFRLSDLGNRVRPLLLCRFLRILAAEASPFSMAFCRS